MSEPLKDGEIHVVRRLIGVGAELEDLAGHSTTLAELARHGTVLVVVATERAAEDLLREHRDARWKRTGLYIGVILSALALAGHVPAILGYLGQ